MAVRKPSKISVFDAAATATLDPEDPATMTNAAGDVVTVVAPPDDQWDWTTPSDAPAVPSPRDPEAVALDLDFGATYTPTTLTLPTTLAYDDWTRIGGTLMRFHDSGPWWLGDWLLQGEALYPDQYSQALDASGKAAQTIANYRWLCTAFAPPRRRHELTPSHHSEVTAVKDPDEQDLWLQRAIDHDWSTRDLRAQIKLSLSAVETTAEETDADDDDEAPSELEEALIDRAFAVQLALRLATDLGYPAGIAAESSVDGYDTLYIDLPGAGQVSWLVPSGDVFTGAFEEYIKPWDGHTTAMARARQRDYVLGTD